MIYYCGMGNLSAAAWVLVLIIVGMLSVVFVLILLRIRAASYSQATLTQKPGPHYSREPKWFEYYRTSSPRTTPDVDRGRKSSIVTPGKDALPRCSRCGAAIAYEEERCHKCGENLRHAQT
jgi:hypothetical protein